MKNNILDMTLSIEVVNNEENNSSEYHIDIVDNGEERQNFRFNLSDEKTDELKKFIDYLLAKINDYDELKINFYDDGSQSLKNIIGINFKEIWENEFKKVKEEINSL